jgi:two-component system sensor histidine kinase VicK
MDDLNLSEEIDKAIEKSKPLLEKNHININSKVDENIMVKADKIWLAEVFDNLISNAVKYTPEGGVITCDAKDDGTFVTVSVADTGIGIGKDQLDRVFEEFYKVDSSRHDLGSSGLGLPICKRIVEKLGGRIWAESPGPGKGTTIFFTLPTSSHAAQK